MNKQTLSIAVAVLVLGLASADSQLERRGASAYGGGGQGTLPTSAVAPKVVVEDCQDEATAPQSTIAPPPPAKVYEEDCDDELPQEDVSPTEQEDCVEVSP
ncbi:MAG: hypothetical protein SGCHY_003885, partial [Lobulomycetales sp.]